MKLGYLSAFGVFGYMEIACSFFPDLTFLTGINGAGKTTALRLISALLRPSLKDLDLIPHTRAMLHISDENGKPIVISSSSGPEGTRISIEHIKEDLFYTNLDPRSYRLRNRPEERVEEHYSILEERFSDHPVLNFLRNEVRTPVFLGLDRKNTYLASSALDSQSYARDPGRLRMTGDRYAWEQANASGLADVQAMLLNEVRRVRERSDRSAEKLRTDILLSAFEFNEFEDLWHFDSNLQRVQVSKELLGRRERIEVGLSGLGIEKEKYSPMLERYFGKIEELASPIPFMKEPEEREKAEIGQVIKLMASRPIVDRMVKLVEMLDKHSSHVAGLWRHVSRFTELANRFLRDTGKELSIDTVGRLEVKIQNGEKRPISVLSSGERQIVVMLGYLTVAMKTASKGIFIVDEPELSLHLRWQEKFVETMREASPNAQLIMATHSPAIVMDMDRNCVDIRGGRRG
ncbi:AAA family ATPase [Cupriavidus sp. BIC8F]|uniref:AAA family ATPase n=1 Tax=Cupriavidus sp. BIC8F TaxID=3079014 RepID=UPI002916D5EE|nr:AAA family ATPase [Cupriavidus sp. BIC8F]